MTTTIMGNCPRTNRLGIAAATHGLATGGRRYYHVRPNVGVVTHQAFGDYDLSLLALRLLETGYSPQRVLEEVKASDRYVEYRQVGVIDRYGNAAAFTGPKCLPWSNHVVGEGYVATGNSTVGERVVQAMAQAFENSKDKELDERLLLALEAERDAGGQPQGQRSSVLVVYDREHYPLMDLRADLHSEPVGELRRIHTKYKPNVLLYNTLRKRPDTLTSHPEFIRDQQQQA